MSKGRADDAGHLAVLPRGAAESPDLAQAVPFRVHRLITMEAPLPTISESGGLDDVSACPDAGCEYPISRECIARALPMSHSYRWRSTFSVNQANAAFNDLTCVAA